ncbi:MAG: arsenite methyltransferase [Dehalococcoidia bacterium]|nr:arsenite methyltransferase [Dehalococcoidia bacterium]
MKPEEIKKVVHEGYSKIASQANTGGCGCGPSCCGGSANSEAMSRRVGYSEKDIDSVPDGANLGLGCGNPLALLSLQEGEVVLDLGSGAGFDAFLAAARVGNRGRVIGVDMTMEMVARARANAEKGGYRNVEFRLGELERLPVADNCVDAVISNCVINLVPDKEKTFQEAFRVLKFGGRIMVSDIVLLRELPQNIRENLDLYIGCVAGAVLKKSYLEAIKEAGFEQIEIMAENTVPQEWATSRPMMEATSDSGTSWVSAALGLNSVVSITVHAVSHFKEYGGWNNLY